MASLKNAKRMGIEHLLAFPAQSMRIVVLNVAITEYGILQTKLETRDILSHSFIYRNRPVYNRMYLKYVSRILTFGPSRLRPLRSLIGSIDCYKLYVKILSMLQIRQQPCMVWVFQVCKHIGSGSNSQGPGWRQKA